ncbi:MAG: ROK family protein [Lachnospiraceae bacterium]|nr:ROK family protein [Lachnospiraceae bacterium]
MAAKYYIGIDMGGTHSAIALVKGLNIVDKSEFATSISRGIDNYVDRLKEAFEEMLERNGLSHGDIISVGMGVPGSVNLDTGMVEYANNLGFNNVPFRDMVSDALGIPVTLDNDANLAAYGEFLLSKSHAKSFLMVTLGTGIGAGIILDGEIYRGVNFAEGEIGHMTIKYDGITCNCGRKGCFEAYASAKALVKMACDAMQSHPECSLWKSSKIDGKAVFAAIEQGDPVIKNVMNEYTFLLSEGLLNIINIFQPEEIAIGGGISARADLFLPDVIERVKQKVYSRDSKKNTIIRAAQYGNDCGLIGAARI